MKTLKIFHDDILVGELTADPKSEQLQLTYDEDWSKRGFALSPHIPVASGASGGVLRRFFENTFPEDRNLEDLLDGYRLSRTQTLRIVEVLGLETVGALSFRETMESPATVFREIPSSELIARLDRRASDGLVFWDQKPRLSVAGVQDKLPVLVLPDGTLGFGEGKLASNTILKFENPSSTAKHLVLNEYLSMSLAEAVGVSVAKVSWRRFGSHPCLVVTRFDRQTKKDVVRRLHVIDGCQALDLPLGHKYERNLGSARDVAHIRDGVSLEKLLTVTEHCRVPAREVLNLIDWVLVNLCLGNADAHGKNISYFVNRAGLATAPFYDLVNVTLYPDFEQGLAMAVDDEFELDGVGAFQLAHFCDKLKLSRNLVSQRLERICARFASELPRLELPSDLTSDEKEFAQSYRQNIEVRVQRLNVVARDLLDVQRVL